MGFYIRKHLNVGPFRFNLSNSGIGVSAGIPGFRVGTGTRGNYVHIGRGGLYYRATLPGGRTPQPGAKRPPASRSVMPLFSENDGLQEIESAAVQNMADSSSAALLEEINSK